MPDIHPCVKELQCLGVVGDTVLGSGLGCEQSLRFRTGVSEFRAYAAG